VDNELLRLEYVPLATVALWDRNPKRHDVGGIIESIERYGFKDPPKFEPALNDGEGGIVEGNGRTVVLRMMQADYEKEDKEPPRGIALSDGDWAVPVLFGVDAASQGAAEAYAIDHNNLTMAGGDFDGFEMARLWDSSYVDMLPKGKDAPVTVDGATMDVLLAMRDIEDFMRPDFGDLIESFDDPEKGKTPKDENWFYVEFYGDDERWAEMSELVKPHLKGASFHELDNDFFYQLVRAHFDAV